MEPVAAQLAVLEFDVIAERHDVGLVSIVKILSKHDVHGEAGVDKFQAIYQAEPVGIRRLTDEPIANFCVADIIIRGACLVVCTWIFLAGEL